MRQPASAHQPATPLQAATAHRVVGPSGGRRRVEVVLTLLGAVVAMSGLVACSHSAKANGHGVFGAAPNGSPGVGAASGIGSAGASAGSATGTPTASPEQPRVVRAAEPRLSERLCARDLDRVGCA